MEVRGGRILTGRRGRLAKVEVSLEHAALAVPLCILRALGRLRLRPCLRGLRRRVRNLLERVAERGHDGGAAARGGSLLHVFFALQRLEVLDVACEVLPRVLLHHGQKLVFVGHVLLFLLCGHRRRLREPVERLGGGRGRIAGGSWIGRRQRRRL